MRIPKTFANVLAAFAFFAASALPAMAQPHRAPAAAAAQSAIPQSSRMEPAQLAAMIHAGHAPVILQVGSHTLYREAHILGAPYAGAGGTPEGLARLRQAVAHLDRHRLLVIYCGCCPWSMCPNIRPAFEELRKMGFTDVRAVYIAHNFGTDWVKHGYPTAKGD
jgi:thiosulfate/3-mercaptopyruvate sulfurtransferase